MTLQLRPDRWWVNMLVGLTMFAVAASNLDRTAIAVLAPLVIAMANFFVAGMLWSRHRRDADREVEAGRPVIPDNT